MTQEQNSLLKASNAEQLKRIQLAHTLFTTSQKL